MEFLNVWSAIFCAKYPVYNVQYVVKSVLLKYALCCVHCEVYIVQWLVITCKIGYCPVPWRY